MVYAPARVQASRFRCSPATAARVEGLGDSAVSVHAVCAVRLQRTRCRQPPHATGEDTQLRACARGVVVPWRLRDGAGLHRRSCGRDMAQRPYHVRCSNGRHAARRDRSKRTARVSRGANYSSLGVVHMGIRLAKDVFVHDQFFP